MVAEHTSAEAMFEGIQNAPFAVMRVEILFAAALQAAAWIALDLTAGRVGGLLRRHSR